MTAAVSDGEGGSHEAAAIAEIVEGSTERAHRLTSIVSRHAILIYLIVVLVVFSIVRPRSFATFRELPINSCDPGRCCDCRARRRGQLGYRRDGPVHRE